jgi:hypothetical protein
MPRRACHLTSATHATDVRQREKDIRADQQLYCFYRFADLLRA